MPKFYYTGGKSGWIGDQPFVYLNTNKIRKLGWKNKFNIRDSIKMTVDLYKAILGNKKIEKIIDNQIRKYKSKL